MDSYFLYVVSGGLLLLSFFKNKEKTKLAIKKGWKSFEKILPQFLTVLMLIGILLSVFDTNTISRIIGADSGIAGVILAAVTGSITLIPGFIAFATASALLHAGAGYMQIAAFISSLMMVGIVTLPLEIQYFGKKVAVLRNLFAFLFSFLVAFLLGWGMLL